MRKLAAVLLFCLLAFACKKDEARDPDDRLTIVEPATTAEQPATTSTPATPTSPPAAETTTSQPPATASTPAPVPFDFKFPDPKKAPPVKYEYLVDTLYDWEVPTQPIVVANY